MTHRILLLGLLSLTLVSIRVHAQQRSTYFDEPGELILPSDYDSDERYPLMVFLPYTGGTSSEQARAFGVEPGEQEGFAVLLPEGRFERSDYLPDFLSFVSWFEERLYRDVSNAVDEYSIDPGQVYVGGYSLGGDLSWALSVRNPDDFAGAVVAGSRSSHPADHAAVERLAEHGFRAALLIGDRDAPDRRRGLGAARRILEAGDVEIMYAEYEGAHELPPQALAVEALEFISANGERRIAAAGTLWPSSPRAPSRDMLSAFRGGAGTTGRLTLEADLPISISRYYTTGVGLTGAGSAGLRYATLRNRAWISADFEVHSGVTIDDRYSRRASSGVAAAFGDRWLFGGGMSWDWARWLSEEGRLDTASDLGPGAIYRRARLSAVVVHRGARRYVPMATLIATYETPSFFSPPVLPHIANLALDGTVWVTDRLSFSGGTSYGTRQRLPVTERSEQADVLDAVFAWTLGAGFSLRDETHVSISHRGEWRADSSGTESGPRSGYEGEWRLSLRFSIL